MSPFPACDEEFMKAALALGHRALGTTGENPSVGCVLVDGSGDRARFVARGWTAEGGRPHAETVALGRSGGTGPRTTAYVTLEPCAHHGRTPPCCDALVDAGVGRVVIGIGDPDPRVAGKGIERLQAAGVEVMTGVCADAARTLHAGFLSRVVLGRPRVLLKLAVSADGKIARATGNRPNMITGPLARRFGHMLRARSDAILVGSGTARADDPVLTCRIEGLEARSPVRIVLDSEARLDPDGRLARSANEVPLWILHRQGASADALGRLERAGARLFGLPTCETTGGLSLPDALDVMGAEGLNTVMIEGGAKVAAAFLERDLVDEVALFRSPDAIAGEGLPALGDLPLEALMKNPEFTPTGEMVLGRDRLFTYEKVRKELIG